jgi:hypothetical protein
MAPGPYRQPVEIRQYIKIGEAVLPKKVPASVWIFISRSF